MTDASAPTATGVHASFDPATKWGRFHSNRFELSLGLPAGREWALDDHSAPPLVATHRATSTRVELRVFALRDLTNRQRCQAEAEARGMVLTALPLSTVDATDETRPGGFATHTRVALEVGPAPKPNEPLRGHVLLFGAKLHRCLVFHFSTEVAAGHETELSDRLALAATRIAPSITFDEGLTEPDAPVPRLTR